MATVAPGPALAVSVTPSAPERKNSTLVQWNGKYYTLTLLDDKEQNLSLDEDQWEKLGESFKDTMNKTQAVAGEAFSPSSVKYKLGADTQELVYKDGEGKETSLIQNLKEQFKRCTEALADLKTPDDQKQQIREHQTKIQEYTNAFFADLRALHTKVVEEWKPQAAVPETSPGTPAGATPPAAPAAGAPAGTPPLDIAARSKQELDSDKPLSPEALVHLSRQLCSLYENRNAQVLANARVPYQLTWDTTGFGEWKFDTALPAIPPNGTVFIPLSISVAGTTQHALLYRHNGQWTFSNPSGPIKDLQNDLIQHLTTIFPGITANCRLKTSVHSNPQEIFLLQEIEKTLVPTYNTATSVADSRKELAQLCDPATLFKKLQDHKPASTPPTIPGAFTIPTILSPTGGAPATIVQLSQRQTPLQAATANSVVCQFGDGLLKQELLACTPLQAGVAVPSYLQDLELLRKPKSSSAYRVKKTRLTFDAALLPALDPTSAAFKRDLACAVSAVLQEANARGKPDIVFPALSADLPEKTHLEYRNTIRETVKQFSPTGFTPRIIFAVGAPGQTPEVTAKLEAIYKKP